MKKIYKENGVSILDYILLVLIIITISAVAMMFTSPERMSEFENQVEGIANTNVIEVAPYARKDTNTSVERVELEITEEKKPVVNEVYQYKRYYYNQLDDVEKKMYNTIINNIDSIKNGYDTVYFDVSIAGAELKFQTVWDSISLDNPELFYIDTSKLSLLTQTNTSMLGRTTYKYMLEPKSGENYFLNTWTTRNEVENAINQVEARANDFLNGATGTTYDKVKYVHDRIIEMAEYDQEKLDNNSNMYGLFVNGKAVCEGYAEGFKYIMDKLNIPCVIIYGNGIDDNGGSEFHSWNEVMMDDGKWYAVDTTWDDPIVIGGGRISYETKHRYFLKGSTNFSGTHINEPDVSGTGQNFYYPELSVTDYNY